MDLPILVVIGESGVGKSTFLNYIAGLNESDNGCNFKVGESDPTRGLTQETSARKVKWLGRGREFIAVDTPGLRDPMGTDTDKFRIKDIVTFIKDGLKPRKIAMFLYLHKATLTRFNFHYLKMFHYMFGDVFWSHLMLEVTWWPHDTRSSRRRQRKRKFLPDRATAKENLNGLIRNLTKIPTGISVPVVFIDSIYDPLDYIDDSETERDKIAQIQRSQVKALEHKLFDASVIGFQCLTCNYDFIPGRSGGSMAP